MLWRSRLFQVKRVNQTAYCRDPIGRNAYPAGVLANAVLVGRKINAVNLVLSDVTMEPLNLPSHFLQDLQ